MFWYPSGQRNQDLEIRPPRHAVALDQAMVLLHEGLRQRQPQAGPAFAPAHEREEDAVLDRVRYTGPVVDDMQFQCQSIALLAEGDLAPDPRLERQLRVAFGNALRK